jgi:predicted site-specific integrase-resolvase
MLAQLPQYIPLSEAARRYDLDPAVLTSMIEDGRIDAVKTNGDIAVAEEDVGIAVMQARARIDKNLQGKPIRLVEAAEKYDISDANLVRWADAGYIGVLERGPKLLMIDEADVKLAVNIFKDARRETGSSVKAGWVLKRTMKRLSKNH